MKEFVYRLTIFPDKYRSATAFLCILVFIVMLDIIFNAHLESIVASIDFILREQETFKTNINMVFAPDVWLALLGLVLGMLIIVISIASQSTPKLIDLYLKDWLSLFYVWFIVLSAIHSVVVVLYNIEEVRPGSPVFNLYVLLTTSIILTLPYVFYMLRYTKTNHVISLITRINIQQIRLISNPFFRQMFKDKKVVEKYQFNIMESMNQLDNLLDYVAFKEPRAEVIQQISRCVVEYVKLKPSISSDFFNVSNTIRKDISFRTMVNKQFDEIEQDKVFLEEKSFRLLGNAYILFLEKDEFDLASLCATELVSIGKAAIDTGDEPLMNSTIIRFNTFMRFAIKHAIKNNEARNLYNLAYHYSNFAEYLIENKFSEQLKRCVFFFKIYSNEIYNHSSKNPSLYFIVAVITFEMRKILKKVCLDNWDVVTQESLLAEFLELDNPPNLNKKDKANKQLVHDWVRDLQIAQALFYLAHNKADFVDKIIHDVLDDSGYLNSDELITAVNASCDRLEKSQPTFWEETDRGNANIFYTDNKDKAPIFRSLFEKKLKA
jgi:hypothetical protein